MPYKAMPRFETGLQELGDGVYAYLQWDGGWGVSNAGFVDGGDEGLLVIDALMAPSMTRKFIEGMRSISDAPFRQLVNTHSHADHTNGNQFIEGAQIIAHKNSRLEMLDARKLATEAARVNPPRGEKPSWIQDAWWEELVEVNSPLPDITYDKSLTLHHGGLSLELRHQGPAHTKGDSLVLFDEQKVLFSGDLCFFYSTPLCRGDMENWIDICDFLIMSDTEKVVPGHGPVGGKTEIADMREYFDVIRNQTRQMFDSGVSVQKAIERVDVGELSKWPESERNAMNVLHLYDKWSEE